MSSRRTTVTRSRRWARYREIAKILYDERCMNLLTLFHDAGIETDECEPLDQQIEHPANGNGDGEDPRKAPREVRVRRAMERLGPAFVKAGQLLSTRRDLISPALANELAKLQDNVPTLPFDVIRERIEEQLGAAIPELFAEFEETPLASASIGQVYRARLLDGTEVVVKVQRPGISETMEVDLDIILQQAHSAAEHTRWGRDLNVVEIAEEMVNALRSELDYLHEANNIDYFHKAFGDSTEVYFPNVYWDLTTSKVLTMEMMRGIPGTKLVENGDGVDRDRIAANGTSCYFKQIFEMGRYHADPHLGNLFVMPDGRVGFVDFGRVGHISERNRTLTFQLIVSLMEGDEVSVTECIIDMTKADPSTDLTELQRDMGRVCTAYNAAQHGASGLDRAVQTLFDAVRKFRLAVPGEVTMLLTVIGVLDGVATQISGGNFQIAEIVGPYAEKMLPEQFAPDNMKHYFSRWLRRYGKFFDDMPVSMSRALRRVGEGEMRIAIRPEKYDRFIDRIEMLVNRVCLAVMLAALILAMTYLVADDDQIPIIHYSSRILLAVCVVIGLWWLSTPLRAAWRRRKY